MRGQDGLVAGVELGGTKTIAVLARGREIVEQAVWPTSTPDQTLREVGMRLREWNAVQTLSALGIASFGPLRLDRSAPDFGHVLDTPKPGWSNAPVAARLTEGLDCPWQIDTDVNAAALAEYRWGAGQGCDSLCYVTIGTGVGGGLVIGGQPVHGAMHPEIGHLRLRRDQGDSFPGICRFHGDCIEGLLSGPALARRFGGSPGDVDDHDERWSATASDLAELLGAVLLATSAQRILIGGGVGMSRPKLIEQARELLVVRMASYLSFLDEGTVRDIIRQPALGDLAGPLGAIALAGAVRANAPLSN